MPLQLFFRLLTYAAFPAFSSHFSFQRLPYAAFSLPSPLSFNVIIPYFLHLFPPPDYFPPSLSLSLALQFPFPYHPMLLFPFVIPAFFLSMFAYVSNLQYVIIVYKSVHTNASFAARSRLLAQVRNRQYKVLRFRLVLRNRAREHWLKLMNHFNNYLTLALMAFIYHDYLRYSTRGGTELVWNLDSMNRRVFRGTKGQGIPLTIWNALLSELQRRH